MSEGAARIEQALQRIEAALARRDAAHRALADRHAALRRQMAQAVEALDALLAAGGGR
ncbi:hypothetical protein [Sphingomonas sp.]|uniref:hypothetical protein n=1 Tax=Sphingomonas sp. TaxID=28214 RepID=UPI001D842450|nr:hypothetical protein [Sphingomonas sp.]MBX9796567.1 hypothetical protein [Sphingomonas sp.]